MKIFCTPQYFFGVFACLFGTVFLFILPPFQAPDEFNHFFRAWQISEGQMTGIRTPENRLGGYVPQSVYDITKPFRHIPFNFEGKTSLDTLYTTQKIALSSPTVFTDFPNTAVYAPSAYVPQAVAIALAKAINAPPLSIFYFARFLTLLFWISIVYVSIKIIFDIQEKQQIPTKAAAWLMTFLALLPGSLFINATSNADVVTNALAFLLFSLFIKSLFLAHQNRRIIVYFGFVAAVITINKLAYLPLIALIFAFPQAVFGTKKRQILSIVAVVVVNIVLGLFWSGIASDLTISYADYHPLYRIGQQINEGVDVDKQINFVIHNPLQYNKILVFSYLKSAPHTLIHIIGKFGWEKNYLPLPLIFLGVLVLVLQAAKVGECGIFSFKNRFLMFGIGIASCILFATVMYIIWLPVGAPFIDNLSGKYFIPILPVFLLAFPRLSYFVRFNFLPYQQSAILLLLLWSVFQICVRYY